MSSAKSRSSSTITTRMGPALISVASAGADRGGERRDHRRIKLALRHRRLQDPHSLHLRHRGTVGAVRQERLETVGHGDDPNLERDLLRAQAIRVAFAVEPLVVVTHDRQKALEALEPRQDLLSQDWVALERDALFSAELPLFGQQRRREAGVADVLEERAQPDRQARRLAEPQRASDLYRAR